MDFPFPDTTKTPSFAKAPRSREAVAGETFVRLQYLRVLMPPSKPCGPASSKTLTALRCASPDSFENEDDRDGLILDHMDSAARQVVDAQPRILNALDDVKERLYDLGIELVPCYGLPNDIGGDMEAIPMLPKIYPIHHYSDLSAWSDAVFLGTVERFSKEVHGI